MKTAKIFILPIITASTLFLASSLPYAHGSDHQERYKHSHQCKLNNGSQFTLVREWTETSTFNRDLYVEIEDVSKITFHQKTLPIKHINFNQEVSLETKDKDIKVNITPSGMGLFKFDNQVHFIDCSQLESK